MNINKTRTFANLAALALALATVPMSSLSFGSHAIRPGTKWECLNGGTSISRSSSDKKAGPKVPSSFVSVPLHFERNEGQFASRIDFVSRGGGYLLALDHGEAVLSLRPLRANEIGGDRECMDRINRHKAAYLNRSLPPNVGLERQSRRQLRMRCVGANPSARATEETPLPGTVNYFVGKDPQGWRRNVQTFERVKYEDIYCGVDLVYYGNQRQLEFDFDLAPGSDPGEITIEFDGAESVTIDASGNLLVGTESGDIHLQHPVCYQKVDGERREIRARFLQKGQQRIGFEVAAYDATKHLIIDPILDYATYFGGSNVDLAVAVAVDSSGNVYLTGQTDSSDLPGMGSSQAGPSGTDAFVAKLDPSGSSVVYLTFIGGSLYETGTGIAVDAAGCVYVAGDSTGSPDFPTSVGAYKTSPSGGDEPFLVKLDANGSTLLYATFLGGSDSDYCSGLAIDSLGHAFVLGHTLSTDFSTTAGSFQPLFGGGLTDAYLIKMNTSGSALEYSTFLGGSGSDTGQNVIVDNVGNAFCVGDTTSPDFPTVNAYQPTFAGSDDGFVLKLDSTGTTAAYSTFLGGMGSDGASDIDIDSDGNAYVAGVTDSADFPTTPGAFQTSYNGGGFYMGFVAKIATSGNALVFSTYLGGSGESTAESIRVDDAGNINVAGITHSIDFPITPSAFQAINAGMGDFYFVRMNPFGTNLIFSSYLGGSSYEEGGAFAIDTAGSIIFVGVTDSADFPIANALQPSSAGNVDAFIVKISNTAEGDNITIAPGAGTTVTFDTVTEAGETTASTSNTGPPPPDGFAIGLPGFYELVTTAIFTNNATVCTDYDPAQFADPSALRLLHFENGVWIDVTVSNDIVNGEICGQVTSFSPFAIATQLPFNFEGFFSPIDGADATGGSFALPLRTFKSKSTIPLKFRAFTGSTPVLMGTHRLQAVKWTSSTTSASPLDAKPQGAAATGNQFRLTGQQWHFELDTTATGMTEGIWQLVATLSDGRKHSVWIKIK